MSIIIIIIVNKCNYYYIINTISIRRLFSMNMKLRRAEKLSSWEYSWIGGSTSTKTSRSQLSKPSNVDLTWLGSCPTLVARGKSN